MSTASEPPGANCAAGGVRLTSASGTSYVCNGSPDSAQQVLSKLLSVDNPGSGISATFLGGAPASAYQPRVTGACTAGMFITAVGADGSVTCTSPYRSTLLVSPVGNPVENGAALTAAMDSITSASASSPSLLKIEPGIYDLGTTGLTLKAWVDVEGSGEATTTLQGAVGSDGFITAGVLTASTSTLVEVRRLTVVNTPASGTNAAAIFVSGGNLLLDQVTVLASGARQNYGLFVSPGTVQLRRGTVRSATVAVDVGGSTFLMLDSDVKGGAVGVSVTSGGANPSTAELRNSSVAGPTAIELITSGSAVRVATSQISGGVSVPTGSVTCVGAFDANYAALGTACQ